MEVVAIDFSPAAVGRALAITRGSGAKVMESDFFTLEADFRLEEDRVSEGSLPVFSGRERWQIWKRRPLKCASGSIFGPIYTEGS